MPQQIKIGSELEPWHDLNGKVVMVTGASSGLGRDFCIDLAKAGCRIVVAARRIDRLVSLCDEVNRMSGNGRDFTGKVRAVAVELDISAKGPVIEASVKNGWEAFGRIDCLINNAGVRGTLHSPLDLSEEEWNSTMRTNLTGTWLVSKYVCIHMRDSKQGGSIINISSISGLDRGHLPGGLAYSASKTGVNSLTKVIFEFIFQDSIMSFMVFFLRTQRIQQVMAMELGMYKIRVNSINPGLFRSEITEGLMEKEWLKNVAQRSVPLKTYGIADPALTMLARYLIHDSSKYVSGNMFIADAGVSLPGVPVFSSL